MANVDRCACCQEIWNRDNLKIVNLGKNKLHLCPDCIKEYDHTVYHAFQAGYIRGNSSAASGTMSIKKAFEQWATTDYATDYRR